MFAPRTTIDNGNPVNRSAPLNAGLDGWWMALPTINRGARFVDLLGKADCAFNGDAKLTGPIGRPGGSGSVYFDGTGDWCESTLWPSGSSGTTFTYATWVCPSVITSGSYFLDHGFGVTGTLSTRSMIVGYQSGNYNIYSAGYPTGTASDSQMAASGVGIWDHVVWCGDGGGKLYGYVNGIQRVNITASAWSATFYAGLSFGRPVNTNSSYYTGYIGEHREYLSRCLSSDQVYALYNASRTGYQLELNRISRPIGVKAAAAPASAGRFFGAGNYTVGA